eukprot:TRINITY_DN55694_c0_g1_i1.p1 TRINITY_DN55694_c0_g1~~TRINITY_DN55694_c0_g1_i1.p1  ORF type:complete len:870 (+),score=111.40 TRINITY_DN55694_c0_g1_i1:64-2610(+)
MAPRPAARKRPLRLLPVLVLLLLPGAHGAGCPGEASGADAVYWADGSGRLALRNGHVCAVVAASSPCVTELYADYAGQGDFSGALNVLAHTGVALAAEFVDSGRRRDASSATDGATAEVAVLSRGPDEAAVRLSGVAVGPAVERWTLRLPRYSRRLSLLFEGNFSAGAGAEAVSVRHTVSTPLLSITALSDAGVTQMMADSQVPYFFTAGAVGRIYALGQDLPADAQGVPIHNGAGGGGALLAERGSSSLLFNGTVLLSAAPNVSSGFEEVVWAAAPWPSDGEWVATSWGGVVPAAAPVAGTAYRSELFLTPSEHDFPPVGVPGDASQIGDTLIPAPPVPADDERAFLTGVYATSVGCLRGPFSVALPQAAVRGRRGGGDIAPTISHPVTGYTPLTNFFDPDSYLTLSAMLYAGDPYLRGQVRAVLEKSMAAMSATGQLPHHFDYDQPLFGSIAGSTQPGPNCFWLLACLQYVKTSGDLSWLQRNGARLRASVTFLQGFWNSTASLFSMPGPLWIDVLVREGITSDSNALLPHVLREWADAEDLLGNSTGAVALRSQAARAAAAFDALLWDARSGDHYITQVSNGVPRDKVDYDSNLLAVAFGAAPASRCSAVLARVDAGNCAHVRPTYVSEILYTGDRDDCYIPGGDHCGDGVVSMGRIAWADAHARKRVGDQSTFDQKIIDPLKADLFNRTWLYERYNCSAQGVRNSFFFEYPSVLAMLLREVRYGINAGLQKIEIAPIAAMLRPGDPGIAFRWRFGDTSVVYNASVGVEVTLPSPPTPGNLRNWRIGGLTPGASFHASAAPLPGCLPAGCPAPRPQTAAASAAGAIEILAPAGACCRLSVLKQAA